MGPDDTEDEEDEAHATQSDALDDAPPSNEAAAAISRVWGRLLSAEDSTRLHAVLAAGVAKKAQAAAETVG